MANWIAVTKDLENKPEIFRIARALGITHCEAVCRCLRVWGWADDQTIDGFVAGVVVGDIDAPAGLPGFGKALVNEKWLLVDDRGVTFPNWSRWNATSAKERDQDRDRKRRQRKRDKGVTEGGTTTGH
jgi:hypothetical protein